MMENGKRRNVMLYLDVPAAYNRGRLGVSGDTSEESDPIKRLLAQPVWLARMTDQETEEVLFELYVARRRRAQ